MQTQTQTEDQLLEQFSMLTISKRLVRLDAPTPDMIDLGDIAHALARICRYGGHVRRHYSVAQHSVLVSWWAGYLAREAGHSDAVEHDAARWGLFHDAAEAYVGDVIRPLKLLLGLATPLVRVERAFERAIAERFELAPEIPALVHQADREVCMAEQIHLERVPEGWVPSGRVAEIPIDKWAPRRARQAFLGRAHMLDAPF